MSRALAAAVLSVALIGCEASTSAGDHGPAASPSPSASPVAVVTQPDQTPAPGQAAPFDSGKAWEHLRQMVAIGPRPAGSEALKQTRAYITRQVSAAGLTVEEQPFTVQTPIGSVNMINLITRLPGRRTDKILITGHYDTKLIKTSVFVGASDGASSAAMLIELARVLKGRSHEYTYEFVWFDGEEAFCPGWDECGRPGSPDNTYGSRYYVDALKKANAVSSVKAMILLDMIGAKNLILRKDTDISTPWLNDLVWATAKKLGHGATFTDQSGGGVGGDDHEPFAKAGIPTVDIIDLADYPQWHNDAACCDDLDHVSARSLQIVGDVVVASLPEIEKRLLTGK
jgi:glutaminyl-peptide cyclotransferase